MEGRKLEAKRYVCGTWGRKRGGQSLQERGVNWGHGRGREPQLDVRTLRGPQSLERKVWGVMAGESSGREVMGLCD